MPRIGNVLCVCRDGVGFSPFMATALHFFSQKGNWGYAGRRFENAGMLESARNKIQPSPNCIISAERLGMNLVSSRECCWVGDLHLSDFDLFVCTDGSIARELYEQHHIPGEKIFNTSISADSWPPSDQSDYDEIAAKILGSMFLVISKKLINKPNEEVQLRMLRNKQADRE